MEAPFDPALTEMLSTLRVEHRTLDAEVSRLSETQGSDSLELRRLKKRKLQIRDYIARLESELMPDLKA